MHIMYVNYLTTVYSGINLSIKGGPLGPPLSVTVTIFVPSALIKITISSGPMRCVFIKDVPSSKLLF